MLIAASGFLGLKVLHPERFARALTPLGYAVLAFDYRGFGASEGERGRLAPQDWVQDIRAAVDRLVACEHVDSTRIGLLGWALGGGVVVAEAADDPRVRAVAAVNAVADGLRCTRNMHDEESWDRLLARIEADRPRRATVGRSEITSPWDIVRLDLDGRTAPYVSEQLYKAPGYGSGVTLESADLLLRFSPERVVGRLAGKVTVLDAFTFGSIPRFTALKDHADSDVLGRFDAALGEFAVAYADQTVQDHRRLSYELDAR